MRGRFFTRSALGAALIAALVATTPAFAASNVLDFEGDSGGLVDRNGVGTGFTNVTEPDTGEGYISDLLEMRDGDLRVTTRPGIQWLGADSLVNGLGLPVPGGTVFTTRTTLVSPPAGSRHYEQAGLWIGTDQDNYAKLVYNSPPSKLRVEFTLELGGSKIAFHRAAPRAARPGSVRLLLRRDRSTGRLSAWYAVNGDALAELGSISVPGDFAAPRPNAYAGIFATHRRGSRPLVYRFGDFASVCHVGCPEGDPGGDPGPGKVHLDEPGAGTGTGGHGTRPFTASVTVPRRVTLTHLRQGIFVRVRCSASCRAQASIGSIRGSSRRSGAGYVRVRLASSARVTRRLRRLARASGHRRVRVRVRTVVSGPRGKRVRSTRTVVVTLSRRM